MEGILEKSFPSLWKHFPTKTEGNQFSCTLLLLTPSFLLWIFNQTKQKKLIIVFIFHWIIIFIENCFPKKCFPSNQTRFKFNYTLTNTITIRGTFKQQKKKVICYSVPGTGWMHVYKTWWTEIWNDTMKCTTLASIAWNMLSI